MKNTKKIITLALCTTLVAQCFCGCKGKKKEVAKTETDTVSQADISSAKEPAKLKNHMTEKELASVTEGPLTVLDEPWTEKDASDSIAASYSDGVYLEIWNKEDMIDQMEEHPEYFDGWTEEDKEQAIENFSPYIEGFIVDGRAYGSMIIPGIGEDGWYGWYLEFDGSQFASKEIKDLSDLKSKLPDILKEYQKKDYQYVFIAEDLDEETMKNDIIRVFEAYQEKTYKELPVGTRNEIADAYMMNKFQQEEDLSWELDKDKIEMIKDQVTEYTIYDAELDRKLVVHVALPKGFDGTSETLPALVLTDAVWRFNDIEKLLKEMEEGRAEPQILISIGQDYKICNSDNMERSALFCEGKDKFLDFITDNLMPYLSEKYSIDYANSTLFGHSLGGVFAHYALCNSDRYENQPFGCYIIGSPAFWSPYSREMSDYADHANDYGFFDRNDTITKRVFITAGSDEDEDYAEYFEDGDSTTESIVHLAERINAKCDPASPMAKDKLYKSHHYQYIPDMLIEYVDGGY